MIDVEAIGVLHATTVQRWHIDEAKLGDGYEDFMRLVCRQHEQNFRLWHEEDIARSTDVSDAELARVKRNIDRLNQQRNDLIEQLDDHLIGTLVTAGVEVWPGAQLNTETPGSAIDRLSILSLRIYHMQQQAERADADESHRAAARTKMVILHQQQHDLSRSLAELLEDIFSGRRRLKVYRQFKMYNDPSMNPYLYGAKQNPPRHCVATG